MDNSLTIQFLSFIKRHLANAPVLLGLSGGPDSMALFHLLLQAKHPFMAAHLDHGWRKESAEEAEILKKICAGFGIPFFLSRLDPPTHVRNLEDACRKKRLSFFKKIVMHENLVGVMLAHHSDDQAETVLKRVFEGSSLQKLRGLEDVSEIENLKIFRPLLNCSKKTLIEWLQAQSISYFIDSTNKDKKFLRSRMREEIFPWLNQHFGKEISKSLCRIAKNASELSGFLDSLILPYVKRIEKKEGKVSLNLQSDPPDSLFMWKAVVREFFNSLNVTFSDAVLETIVSHLQQKTKKVTIRVAKRSVLIEDRRISVNESDDFK